jgi:hypothetical protein
MDRVEGLIPSLKLPEVERKGVKISQMVSGKGGAVEVQVIGKLMSDTLAIAEAMENALEPIWYPMKGIYGEEIGKKKAKGYEW